jgi:hypothetical protein
MTNAHRIENQIKITVESNLTLSLTVSGQIKNSEFSLQSGVYSYLSISIKGDGLITFFCESNGLNRTTTSKIS